jgi:D-lyxose ketol-isomerase
MKRSVINRALAEASAVFASAGWVLPPQPRWDVSDCGSGDFDRCGIVLVNLADDPKYGEKLIYMRRGQTIPLHTHRVKQEDIICRRGRLKMELWAGHPSTTMPGDSFSLKRNGVHFIAQSGVQFELSAGERVTLVPGVYHRFEPVVADTVIGEVSTANDDLHDNIFADPTVTRFPDVEEDEPATVRLVSDR